MAWLFLFLAGLCEMAWPIGFKYTDGFKHHFWITALTMAMMLLSFFLLSQAINRGVHMGTAYAVWTGLGAAGTATLGILLFDEPRQPLRLVCLALIICGAAGLKLFAPTP